MSLRETKNETAAGAAPALLRWWQLTLAASALLTLFDVFLLQQRKSFFTGGFLSVDHAQGAGQVLAFLAASLAADAAVAGVTIAVALWLSGLLRLKPAARALAVLTMGLAPLVIADFVSYRLMSYLGDAFDLSLMFDLADGRPDEMLAVGAGHLVRPAIAVLGLGAMAGALVWGVNKFRAGVASTVRVPFRIFAAAAAFFVAVLVATTTVRAHNDMMENGLRRKPTGKVLAWLADTTTDVDRDGFGIGGLFRDPAPFDAAVFPFAADVPGNGIDENGVGGDLPAAAASYGEPPDVAGPWRHTPDVVMIVLESFRADAVGATANGRPVTPALEELASRGVSSARAYSHNGYTAPSRFHLMSGSLANLRGGRTLVDDFKANGYEVAYFSGQDESFGNAAFSVGFDRAHVQYDARQEKHRRYSTFTTAGSLAVPSDVVLEHVTAFLSQRAADRPLFLYINFHDTHYPYGHSGIRPLVSNTILRESAIVPSRAGELREMYLNTAANVDYAIAETLKVVRSHLRAEPAVIVTADHGESLFEEGFLGHGYALDDAQTRVPLIASGLPLTIAEPFGQSDLRDAIALALTGEDFGAPALVPSAERVVFQYLGNIDRPRQIAFADGVTRTIFDFRTGTVQIAGGSWQEPANLNESDNRRFLELVRFWERIVVARRGSVTRATDE